MYEDQFKIVSVITRVALSTTVVNLKTAKTEGKISLENSVYLLCLKKVKGIWTVLSDPHTMKLLYVNKETYFVKARLK